MQISVALLVGRSSASRPAGTVEGAHRRDRRDQTPQPPCWLSPHRTAACARLWHRYQQRHRPPGARETLSTRGRNRWPVLAELYRACEGQPVERRSVPLRIDTPAQPLGHGGDGRVHTSITTMTQWLRRSIDSQRNRSTLHRLSFTCPIKLSQDGPSVPASGR